MYRHTATDYTLGPHMGCWDICFQIVSYQATWQGNVQQSIILGKTSFLIAAWGRCENTPTQSCSLTDSQNGCANLSRKWDSFSCAAAGPKEADTGLTAAHDHGQLSSTKWPCFHTDRADESCRYCITVMASRPSGRAAITPRNAQHPIKY